jgi:integrase
VAQIVLERKLGTFSPPVKYAKNYNPTVAELLKEFVELYGVNHWGDSFLSCSQHRIDDYIVPLIGNVRVKDVTLHMLERFYDELQRTPAIVLKGHKDTGKTVSHGVIESIHGLLKNAFNRAIRWGYLSTNPAMTAEVPQYEKNERTVWTAETAQKALSLCRERKLKLAMQLALGCSMRIGEILGLTWDCVDIRPERIAAQDAQLHVNKELKRCQKDAMEKLKARNRSKVILEFPELKADCSTVLVLKSPKTSSSVRNIFIPNTVAIELVKEQDRQQAMKAMLGDVYEDYNLVLAQDNGRPVEEAWMRKHLNAFIKANDLPVVVFHSLRHSSTSIKLELSQGNIKAVQGDTGHAQSNMVTDVYAHSNNTERKKLARLVEQQFFNRTGDSEQIPADDKTVKIIGLLKERPEMTDTFLTLLNAMVC